MTLSIQTTVTAATNTQDVQNFVSRFYTEVLGRTADQAGLDDWTNRLVTGTSAGSDVATGFIFSDEFMAKPEFSDDGTFVTILYRAFFNRDADTAGLNGWLTELAGGTSKEDVLNGFLYSQEFANLTAAYGIKPVPDGSSPSSIGGSVEDFVKRFYSVVLGRTADAGGLADWITQLERQTKAGGDIAKGFFNSQEFTNRNLDNSTFIDICYKAFFGRDADAGGKAYWLNLLDTGATKDSVLNGFIDSEEFSNLALRYGIEARSPIMIDLSQWYGQDYFWTGEIFASEKSPMLYVKNAYGIYGTNDGGVSWISASQNEIDSIIPNTNDLYDDILNNHKDFFASNAIEDIVVTDEGIVYVATYRFIVYRYEEDKSLTNIDPDFAFNSSPGALYFDNTNKVLYTSTYWDGIYKYVNNKWVQITNVTNDFPRDAGVESMTITPDGTLYALVKDQLKSLGIYKYNESDDKWLNINYNLPLGLVVNIDKIVSNSSGEVFINSIPRGIFRKSTNNNHWEEINNNGTNLYPKDVTKIIVNAYGQVFALSVGTGGGIGSASGLDSTLGIFNTNNNITWTEFSDGMKTDNVESDLSADPATGDIFINRNLGSLNILDMELHADALYVLTYNEGLYKKPLFGGLWSHGFNAFESSPNAIEINDLDNIIYVNTYHTGIYKSTDDGKTFSKLNSPQLSAYTAVLQLEENILYLLSNSFEGEVLYQSIDSGNTWMKIELPATVSSKDIVIKNNILYLLTNQGLYTYINNVWTQVSTQQNLKYISINDANIIVVSTEKELYKSQDNGNTWSAIDTVGIKGGILSLKINHNTIYIGTDKGFFLKNLF